MYDLDQAQKEMEEEKNKPVSAEVQAARDKKRKELQEEKDKRRLYGSQDRGAREEAGQAARFAGWWRRRFLLIHWLLFFISTLSSFSCLRLLETLISSGLLDKGGCQASGKACAGPSPTLSTYLAVTLPHHLKSGTHLPQLSLQSMEWNGPPGLGVACFFVAGNACSRRCRIWKHHCLQTAFLNLFNLLQFRCLILSSWRWEIFSRDINKSRFSQHVTNTIVPNFPLSRETVQHYKLLEVEPSLHGRVWTANSPRTPASRRQTPLQHDHRIAACVFASTASAIAFPFNLYKHLHTSTINSTVRIKQPNDCSSVVSPL